ncbi:DUF4625 domain-containing protein [Pedobacter psychroterrae]|uniref:DUF4625 domain-containing protein n=1 Tax=Pedobacter psychroterrae TaxID=2530453 RepID=A0A4R0NQY6_9SPHI|nr:DUF4625 domain-containing protein [Pedobacter psychroterrae]TCD03491.1 DUF4625 domain-containing protein [Pedobacter psychroterrae]
MKKLTLIGLLPILLSALSSCKKEKAEPIDTSYPEINVSIQDAFPKQCSVLKRGQSFTFRALLTDNAELGSLSVDIHHNFDHHSHSTEVSDCTMSPVKHAVKPFLLIRSFPIAAGLQSFQTNAEISVPADIDPGDYHFLIRLTDKQGWQTIKGLSIKIE